MRNSHEALRAALREMAALVEEDASKASELHALFEAYERVLKVHSDMEDNDLFPLLDRTNGAPLNLGQLHVDDHVYLSELKASLSKAGSNPSEEDWETVKRTYCAWSEFHENHFSSEEKTVMPMTKKVHSDPIGRCRVVHEHLVNPAMARNADEFLHYIAWCAAKLNQYGSGQQPAKVAVRVFVRALHSASSAEQWKVFMPALRESCSEEIWKEIVDTYHVDSPFGDDRLKEDAPPASSTSAITTIAAEASTIEPKAGRGEEKTSAPKGCCVVS